MQLLYHYIFIRCPVLFSVSWITGYFLKLWSKSSLMCLLPVPVCSGTLAPDWKCSQYLLRWCCWEAPPTAAFPLMSLVCWLSVKVRTKDVPCITWGQSSVLNKSASLPTHDVALHALTLTVVCKLKRFDLRNEPKEYKWLIKVFCALQRSPWWGQAWALQTFSAWWRSAASAGEFITRNDSWSQKDMQTPLMCTVSHVSV